MNPLRFIHIPVALYHRRFLYLWLGLMISVAGSQMQLAAIHWHINEITPEPLALGLIGAARILPVIVFSLVAGAVADSANRRWVLLVTQSSQLLLAAALALLTFSGAIMLWHIYLITALQAVSIAFDGPARQSLVPNLVPGKDLPNAFSLTSIAFSTGSIVGPALGGYIIARWTLGAAYLLNAISFLAVIFALLAMGQVEQRRTERKDPVSWEAIREGVRFIWHNPLILSTMITDFAATFFSSANTLMPIVAKQILKVGEEGYGWLVAAQPAGALLAASVISQFREIRRQGPVFLVSVVFFGLSTIAFGFAPNLAVAFATLMMVGASDSVSTVIRNTIRNLNTPDEIRGRMTSINQIFFMGGPQLGEIEAGVVAQLFGVPFAIISGGVACLVSVGAIVRKWPHLLKYDH